MVYLINYVLTLLNDSIAESLFFQLESVIPLMISSDKTSELLSIASSIEISGSSFISKLALYALLFPPPPLSEPPLQKETSI